MIKVGDKVVVTDVPEGCGLEGIEVGSVGEVVRWCDGISVNILFGDGKKFLGYVDEGEYLKSKNCGYTHVFLVEKVEDGETGDTPEEEGIEGTEIRHSVNVVEDNVGEALTVEEVIKSVIEENKKGTKPDEELTKDNEAKFKVGVDNGEGFWRKGGKRFTLGETETYIKGKQDIKASDNTSEGGAYNTVIKKDGLTIYTNYSVDIVGELVRVGGVDNLVSHLVESEDAALEED